MIKLRKIIFLLVGIAIAGSFWALFQNNSKDFIVKASGGMEIYVDGKRMNGKPIFNYSNVEPGNNFFHDIKLKNSGTVPLYAKVIAEKVNGNGNLESMLKVIINNGSEDKFNGSLQDFFNLKSQNGVALDIIPANSDKTYHFNITFNPNSGNNFQNTNVIFDLDFGSFAASNLVINEVYYNVSSKYGDDSYKDRFLDEKDEKDKNKDIFNFKINGKCFLFQGNSRNPYNKFNFFYYFNFFRFNYGFCNEQQKGHDDEWVELYNATTKDISLKNWSFTDNSGNQTKITANKIIKAGGFALISKDSDTWDFWKVNKSAVKVELGSEIGDGLDNSGDHLILKNPSGQEIDKVGWGNDTVVWNPAVSGVPAGSSIERLTPGFDFDSPTDWVTKNPPTPGN